MYTFANEKTLEPMLSLIHVCEVNEMFHYSVHVKGMHPITNSKESNTAILVDLHRFGDGLANDLL